MSLNNKLDGRQATKKVIDYFTETYGSNGVIQFEIINVDFDSNKGVWTIDCGFFRNYVSSIKDFYKVEVNSDGDIASVKRIQEQPR